MNRLAQKAETSRRVLYFLCQLERCGDEDFVSRLPMTTLERERNVGKKQDRSLLFSTN